MTDIRMPPDDADDGARAASVIRERHPDLGIVLLSQHGLSERTVETHVTGIIAKLGLAGGADDHRRVLAVLAYLGASRD